MDDDELIVFVIPKEPNFSALHEPWMDEGECKKKKAPPELFILPKGQTSSRGRRYCRKCSVKFECEMYARRTGSVGLWGGKVFSFQERDPVSRLPIEIAPVVFFDPGEVRSAEDVDFLRDIFGEDF